MEIEHFTGASNTPQRTARSAMWTTTNATPASSIRGRPRTITRVACPQSGTPR